MTKVSVLYPNAADARFDMAYYCNSHMPMVRDKLSAACRRIEVDEGVGGGQPGVARQGSEPSARYTASPM